MSCAAVSQGWNDIAFDLCDRADRSVEEILTSGAELPEWLFAAYVIESVLALGLLTAFILGMEALTSRIYLVFFITVVVFEVGLHRAREPVPCKAGHEPGYLLRWDRVPGDDDGRLRCFLCEEMDVTWADQAGIERSDDDKELTISSGDDWVRIILGRRDGRALVVTSDRRTRYLDARGEDGAFDLYLPDNREKGRFLVYALCMWGSFLLGFFFIMILDVDLTSTIAGRLTLIVVWLKLYSIIDEQTVPMLLGEEAEWTDEDLALAGLCWEGSRKGPLPHQSREAEAVEPTMGKRRGRTAYDTGWG